MSTPSEGPSPIPEKVPCRLAEFYKPNEERPKVPTPAKFRKLPVVLPVIKEDAGGECSKTVNSKADEDIETGFTSDAGSSLQSEDDPRSKKCMSSEERKALEDRRSTRMNCRSPDGKSTTPEQPDLSDNLDTTMESLDDSGTSEEDDNDELVFDWRKPHLQAIHGKLQRKEAPRKRKRTSTPLVLKGDAQAESMEIGPIPEKEIAPSNNSPSDLPDLPAIASPPVKRCRGRPKKNDNAVVEAIATPSTKLKEDVATPAQKDFDEMCVPGPSHQDTSDPANSHLKQLKEEIATPLQKDSDDINGGGGHSKEDANDLANVSSSEQLKEEFVTPVQKKPRGRPKKVDKALVEVNATPSKYLMKEVATPSLKELDEMCVPGPSKQDTSDDPSTSHLKQLKEEIATPAQNHSYDMNCDGGSKEDANDLANVSSSEQLREEFVTPVQKKARGRPRKETVGPTKPHASLVLQLKEEADTPAQNYSAEEGNSDFSPKVTENFSNEHVSPNQPDEEVATPMQKKGRGRPRKDALDAAKAIASAAVLLKQEVTTPAQKESVEDDSIACSSKEDDHLSKELVSPVPQPTEEVANPAQKKRRGRKRKEALGSAEAIASPVIPLKEEIPTPAQKDSAEKGNSGCSAKETDQHSNEPVSSSKQTDEEVATPVQKKRRGRPPWKVHVGAAISDASPVLQLKEEAVTPAHEKCQDSSMEEEMANAQPSSSVQLKEEVTTPAQKKCRGRPRKIDSGLSTMHVSPNKQFKKEVATSAQESGRRKEDDQEPEKARTSPSLQLKEEVTTPAQKKRGRPKKGDNNMALMLAPPSKLPKEEKSTPAQTKKLGRPKKRELELMNVSSSDMEQEAIATPFDQKRESTRPRKSIDYKSMNSGASPRKLFASSIAPRTVKVEETIPGETSNEADPISREEKHDAEKMDKRDFEDSTKKSTLNGMIPRDASVKRRGRPPKAREAAKETLDTTEPQTTATAVVRRGRPPKTGAVVQETANDSPTEFSPASERKKEIRTSPVKKTAKETPKSDAIHNPIGTAKRRGRPSKSAMIAIAIKEVIELPIDSEASSSHATESVQTTRKRKLSFGAESGQVSPTKAFKDPINKKNSRGFKIELSSPCKKVQEAMKMTQPTGAERKAETPTTPFKKSQQTPKQEINQNTIQITKRRGRPPKSAVNAISSKTEIEQPTDLEESGSHAAKAKVMTSKRSSSFGSERRKISPTKTAKEPIDTRVPTGLKAELTSPSKKVHEAKKMREPTGTERMDEAPKTPKSPVKKSAKGFPRKGVVLRVEVTPPTSRSSGESSKRSGRPRKSAGKEVPNNKVVEPPANPEASSSRAEGIEATPVERLSNGSEKGKVSPAKVVKEPITARVSTGSKIELTSPSKTVHYATRTRAASASEITMATPTASPTKESRTKKSPTKISPTKKSPTKNSPTKKSPTKKSPAKTTPAKITPAKAVEETKELPIDLESFRAYPTKTKKDANNAQPDRSQKGPTSPMEAAESKVISDLKKTLALSAEILGAHAQEKRIRDAEERKSSPTKTANEDATKTSGSTRGTPSPTKAAQEDARTRPSTATEKVDACAQKVVASSSGHSMGTEVKKMAPLETPSSSKISFLRLLEMQELDSSNEGPSTSLVQGLPNNQRNLATPTEMPSKSRVDVQEPNASQSDQSTPTGSASMSSAPHVVKQAPYERNEADLQVETPKMITRKMCSIQ